MKITKFLVEPFSVPFSKPFKTSRKIYTRREGIWIKIFSNDYFGVGEAAPLEGFNLETIKEVHYAIEGFKQSIEGIELDKEELFSLIEVHAFETPSVRFALETAINDILSKEKNLSIAKYLNLNSESNLPVNGLAGIHLPTEGFKVIKVKVGFRNLYDEIENMQFLTQFFGENVLFRLDCNEVYDLSQSIRFCKEMEAFNIDYIEQPMPALELEDLAELRYHTRIPIAVDESLSDFNSAEQIIEAQAADVLVLKPMVSGGFLISSKILSLARKEGLRTIITSTLETAIGRMSCLHLALANEISEVCGLATGDLLEESSPDLINNGLMQILSQSGLGLNINNKFIN